MTSAALLATKYPKQIHVCSVVETTLSRKHQLLNIENETLNFVALLGVRSHVAESVILLCLLSTSWELILRFVFMLLGVRSHLVGNLSLFWCYWEFFLRYWESHFAFLGADPHLLRSSMLNCWEFELTLLGVRSNLDGRLLQHCWEINLTLLGVQFALLGVRSCFVGSSFSLCVKFIFALLGFLFHRFKFAFAL